MGLAIAVLVIGIIACPFIIMHEKSRAQEEEQRKIYMDKQREHDLQKQGVDTDSLIQFEYQQNIAKQKKNFSVKVDEKNEKLFIFENDICHAFNFKDITGFEVKMDNESLDSGGRALAGAVLGGAAGAIVGASSARGKISSCVIYIYTKSIANPYTEIVLFKNFITDRQYMFATYGPKEFLDRLSATLKAIVNKNNEA